MMRSEGQQRSLQALLNLVLSALRWLVSSLVARIVIALSIAVIAAIGVTEASWPAVAPVYCQQAGERIATEMSGAGTPTSFGILKLLHRYDLSWLYITQNGRLLDGTSAFAPYMRNYPLISGEVTVKGQRYTEAVVPITINEAPASLHAGVCVESPAGSNLFAALSTAGMFARVPGLYLFILMPQILLSVILFPLLYLGLSQPLNSLTKFLKESRAAAAPYSEAEFAAQTAAPLQLAEISSFRRVLFETLQNAGVIESDWSSKEDAQRWKGKKARITEEMVAPPLPQEGRPGSSTGRFGIADMKLKGLLEELGGVTNLKSFSRRLLDGLSEAFPESLKKSALVRKGIDGKYIVLSAHGLSNKTVSVIERIDHVGAASAIPAGSGTVSDVGSMLMRRFGLEPIAEEESVRRIVYFSIIFGNEVRALLIAFIERPESLTSEQTGMLESFLNQQISPAYSKLLLTEEAEEAQRTDQLTGLKNKKFLQEALAIEVQRTNRDGRESFTLFFIGGDGFDVIETRHGLEVRDKMLQELAASLRSSFRTTRSGQDAPAFWLARFEDEEFAVIAGSCNSEQAPKLAFRLRDSATGKRDSVAGVPLTASVGYAICPMHGETSEALLAGARKALYYAWNQLGPSSIVSANQVPVDFVPSQKSSAMAGELGVLDSPSLLQSIAGSEKTGLLTVEDLSGRVFKMSFENGAPQRAQLDNLTGLAALIEYVLSYSTGRFEFKQSFHSVDPDHDVRLPGADLPGLDKCLMEAALAEDNLTNAKKTLPHLDYFVRVTPGINVADHMDKIRESNDDLSDNDILRIQELLSTAYGAHTLKELFEKLPSLPTYLKWRWCSLLLKAGSIQMKAMD